MRGGAIVESGGIGALSKPTRTEWSGRSMVQRKWGNDQSPPGSFARKQARGAAAHARGLHAEHAAMAWLRQNGWTILEHRARTRWGEIDLVARRDDLLAFCEIKSRPSYGEAAECLTPCQMRRLANAAVALCAAHPDWLCGQMRFDVLLVVADGSVHHIADAFRPEM
ncbi:YraN family protein [Gluconacetobacter sacchari]|nr:YraN family protein [Gluconacetobacter sacchari]